jgi:hypothetical protein
MRYIAVFIAGLVGFCGTAVSATLSCSEPGNSEVGDQIFTGFDISADTVESTVQIIMHYRDKNDPRKRSELITIYKNGASGNVTVSYTSDGVSVPGLQTIRNNQIVTIRRDLLGWGSNGRYENTWIANQSHTFAVGADNEMTRG